MNKDRLRLVSSTNYVGKKKRNFKHYFDGNPTQLLTPNQRSMPKKKGLFKDKSKGKSFKKEVNSRRNSHQKRERKIDFSPPQNKHLKKSGHKHSRFQHSNQKQYDSPSRDQEEMDLILGKRYTKKQKGPSNSYIEQTIEKVNQNLKNNHLNEAIFALNQTLRQHPNNFDLNYLLGICHIISNSYEMAINVFEELLRSQPRKNIYLLLSVCYKKIEDYDLTLHILDQCIQKYPKYYEAYIYRGKLYLKVKDYKKAFDNFERALGLNSEKQIGLIGKGDCLRLMEHYEEAKSLYSRALNHKVNSSSVLLRRAICNVELKRYDVALEDINRLLEADSKNSQALYFKGLIMSKQKNMNEALICYEQAIKHNTNKKAVTRALYEITKIKIQNRDYYQALYTLERAQFLDIDQKVIKKFKIFIDGVTSMMKKNYEEGIKTLTQLANDSEKPMSNFLKPLFYSSRSYGYMSLEKYTLAKEDLSAMEQDFSLDLPNLFNKFVCEGILACNAMQYENALAFFSKAGKAQPHRIQPFYYKAVTLICFAHKLLPKDLQQKKVEYLESAMKTINKCSMPLENNNPSLFMVRGFLHFASGNLENALQDFEACLNESTKPNPLTFYLNGLVLGQAGKYEEANHEFKKAIDADEKHELTEVYLSRAKCNVILGEINNGFQDLQSYMTYKPTSPDIHIWAGHLLFHIGACEDAAKAYSNINNIAKNPEVLLYRAMCHLTSKDVISTTTNLKMILEVKYSNEVFFDCEMLEALRECSEDSVIENEEGNGYALILKRIKSAKEKVSNLGDFKLGNFFEICEYQFYKAVLYFFDGKYEDAAKNFMRAADLAAKRVENEAESDPTLVDYYKNSSGNRAFSFFEVNYNIAVCEILIGNLAKASRFLNQVSKQAAEQGYSELRNDMELLINLLSQETLKRFDKKPSNQQEGEEQSEFYPFPSENRLCSIFPDIVLPFSTAVKTKLYFCLPYVRRPEISLNFDFKILEYFDMKVIEVKPEAPWIRRCEQGVIFTDQVVKYDIELSESSSEKSGDEPDEQYEGEQESDDMGLDYEEAIPYRNNEHSDRGRRYSDEESEEQMEFDPRKLKEMFKLDPATQERLNKIKNK